MGSGIVFFEDSDLLFRVVLEKAFLVEFAFYFLCQHPSYLSSQMVKFNRVVFLKETCIVLSDVNELPFDLNPGVFVHAVESEDGGHFLKEYFGIVMVLIV